MLGRLALLVMYAACAIAPMARATTMAVDMGAPAHASHCLFNDGTLAELIRWDHDPNTSFVVIDRADVTTVAMIVTRHGRPSTIEVNGGVASIQAFNHLYTALSAMPQTAIPRGGFLAFDAQRDGLPSCPWPSMDALYTLVNDEISRGIARSRTPRP